MEIKLKFGVESLVFGMGKNDVQAILGNPDKEYKDEDENLIYLYNRQKLRLTFYKDENFRLGYIIASHQDSVLFGVKIIGKEISEVKNILSKNGIIKLDADAFDSFENFFNEENWITIQTEYGEATKIEIGATINAKDEFDWKFK